MAEMGEQSAPGSAAEPGYYRDPLGGSRARWWTGEAWTHYIGPQVADDWPWEKPLPFPERKCRGCGTVARTWGTQCEACGRAYTEERSPRRGMITTIIVITVLVAAAGGVSLLLSWGEDELKEHEISRDDFDSVAIGTSRADVESRFGPPLETTGDDGLECLTYYDGDSDNLLEASFFDLCFTPAGVLSRKDDYGIDESP